MPCCADKIYPAPVPPPWSWPFSVCVGSKFGISFFDVPDCNSFGTN